MDQPLDQIQPGQTQLVLATFEQQQTAGEAVQALRARGIPEQHISLAVRHDSPEVSAREMAALDREAEATGADVAVGSAAGGLMGFIAGLALFSIPGLGPFLGVGVLASTLGGAAIGSAVGERVAHFIGLGLPEERAAHYRTALEAGHVVVAITAPDANTLMVAREVLTQHGASAIDAHPAPASNPASATAAAQPDSATATTPGRSNP